MENPNPVGNASLGLGIVSLMVSSGIALYTFSGSADVDITLYGTPLWVGGITGALLGLAGLGLGLIGLFGRGRSRATALAGIGLGLLGASVFFLAASAVGPG